MERFKNYVWMAAGFVILAAAISAFVPGSALAQIVKAALVKNVDEHGRSPYTARIHCETNGTNSCSAETDPVPAGKRLVIEHINAGAQITGKILFYKVFVNGLDYNFAPTLNGNDGVLNNYALNEPALIYLEAGQKALVLCNTSAIGVNNSAFLTGYLIDLSI